MNANKTRALVIGILLLLAVLGTFVHSNAKKTPSPASPQTIVPASQQDGSLAAVGTGFTLAQISTHNSAASCWTTINGGVYDLTSWVNQHPGGEGAILSICGIDGSAAFNAQHGGQGRPERELATFKIGTLIK